MLHLPVLAPTNDTLNGGIGQPYRHRRRQPFARPDWVAGIGRADLVA